jgi:acylphosphatase
MVQGVGFRYTTQRIAAAFAVTGYVQNLPDGRVRVVGEGEPAELDRFLKAVMDYLGHHVSDTEISVKPAEDCFRGFRIEF